MCDYIEYLPFVYCIYTKWLKYREVTQQSIISTADQNSFLGKTVALTQGTLILLRSPFRSLTKSPCFHIYQHKLPKSTERKWL